MYCKKISWSLSDDTVVLLSKIMTAVHGCNASHGNQIGAIPVHSQRALSSGVRGIGMIVGVVLVFENPKAIETMVLPYYIKDKVNESPIMEYSGESFVTIQRVQYKSDIKKAKREEYFARKFGDAYVPQENSREKESLIHYWYKPSTGRSSPISLRMNLSDKKPFRATGFGMGDFEIPNTIKMANLGGMTVFVNP